MSGVFKLPSSGFCISSRSILDLEWYVRAISGSFAVSGGKEAGAGAGAGAAGIDDVHAWHLERFSFYSVLPEC